MYTDHTQTCRCVAIHRALRGGVRRHSQPETASDGRGGQVAGGQLLLLARWIDWDAGGRLHPASSQPCNDIASRTDRRRIMRAMTSNGRWPSQSSQFNLHSPPQRPRPQSRHLYTIQTVYIRNLFCIHTCILRCTQAYTIHDNLINLPFYFKTAFPVTDDISTKFKRSVFF